MRGSETDVTKREKEREREAGLLQGRGQSECKNQKTWRKTKQKKCSTPRTEHSEKETEQADDLALNETEVRERERDGEDVCSFACQSRH